jgi:hypothetical protein
VLNLSKTFEKNYLFAWRELAGRIIDWKKKRKIVQKIEIITINSSENDKSDHKFTIVPSRREVRR